ncbi:MAG: hypothetical protein EXS59_02335 [Candidatus Taylorbacteria bacterium]|nr:hypothetical protein [Candidatus Taylorbacteria bacterium]
MSSTTKWVIGIIIIVLIVLGLWKGGYLGNATSTDEGQGAAVVTAPVDVSDVTIANEAAAIDAQMQVAGNQLAGFNKTPEAGKIDLLAGQLANTGALINALANRMQIRATSLKGLKINTDAIQMAISNLKLQVSYASSEAGATGELAKGIMTGKGNKDQANNNKTIIDQAKLKFQKSYSYLVAGRMEITNAISAFKAVTASQGVR